MDHSHRIAPTKLRVEASTACQLACPACSTSTGKTLRVLGRGFLRPRDLERLLDQTGSSVGRIELSNYGEPFLNPELLEIFRIAHERGVDLTISNGANLNNVRPEVLEGLVKYGVKAVLCSIDGTTQEVYEQYRQKGTLAAVMENIKSINRFKAEYQSQFPVLTWQFILFEHNKHQVNMAKMRADYLGMNFWTKLSWSSKLEPKTGVEELEQVLGMTVTRAETERLTNTLYLDDICSQLWDDTQINSDGKVLGCCTNTWAEFGGNAFDDLDSALNSTPMQQARAMLTGEIPAVPGVPCTTCIKYRKRQELGKWVNRAEP